MKKSIKNLILDLQDKALRYKHSADVCKANKDRYLHGSFLGSVMTIEDVIEELQSIIKNKESKNI